MANTPVRLRLRGNQVRSYSMDSKTTMRTLDGLGISFDESAFVDAQEIAKRYPAAYGLDAAPTTITTPSVPNAIQFLQHWLAPMVEIVTWARTIDALLGRDMAGSWYQEEIVQPVLEKTGQARPYSDASDTNLVNWNLNFGTRTIVRQEADAASGILESYRAAEMRVDNMGVKRAAAAQALEITRNAVGFYGYNAGAGRTYGILNDPNLLNYTTVSTGASGDTTFASKTFDEIVSDFKSAFSKLRSQSGTNVDPNTAKIRIGIASSVYDMLQTMNSLGTQTVRQWVEANYKGVEFVAIPEFDGANGGENVAYIIAESVAGQNTVAQNVQDLLRMIGAERKAKGFVEVYSNATAGVMVKQPIGIVRLSGI